jgi:hypothetical protein
MARRTIRLGLRLGLLAGVLVALVKLVQSRRSSREESWAPSPAASWPPIQPDPVTVEPAASTTTERLPPVRTATVEAPARPAPDAADGADDAPDLGAADEAAIPDATDEAPDLEAATGAAAEAAIPDATAEAPDLDVANDAAAEAAVPAAAETTEADTPVVVPPMAPLTSDAEHEPLAAMTLTPAAVAPATKAWKSTRKAATGPTPARTRVRKSRRPWVDPVGTDAPASHPVKAKLSSMLYHLPGMAFYGRTHPDRCYIDAETAEADGFTRAKR